VPESEAIYGAGRAALEATRASGRGSVVIDAACGAEDLPDGDDVVWISVWRKDDERALASGRGGSPERRGIALALIPGWTARPEFLRDFLPRCRSRGLGFAVPLEMSLDGYSRSAIHADFAALYPDRADVYFDRLHHRDAASEIAEARAAFEEIASAVGISARAPMPRGTADYDSNLRAREALEREADRCGEPRASLLRGASRRIEDFGRDVGELARQGNSRLLFPAGSPEWPVVEQALGIAPAEAEP
jgi:hypothetical protein